MGEHIPGPWQALPVDPDTGFAHVETVERGRDVPLRGYPVADVYTGTGPDDPTARLVAAAPAMLEALRAQVDWWGQLPSGVDYDADPDDLSPEDAVAHIAGLAIREARAAIAAATGGTD